MRGQLQMMVVSKADVTTATICSVKCGSTRISMSNRSEIYQSEGALVSRGCRVKVTADLYSGAALSRSGRVAELR